MLNLSVSCDLLTEVLGDIPHLDSVLEFSIGTNRHSVQNGFDVPLNVEIPVKRTVKYGMPVAHCSSPIYQVANTRIVRHTRSVPTEHARLLDPRHMRAVRIDTSWTKQRYVPCLAKSISRVVWFCVGIKRDLEQCLSRITNLGKFSGYGYGMISGWSVEPIKDDYSWYANNILMRPLPLPEIKEGTIGFRKDFGSCCPPYWHHQRYMEIGTPC